jgi:gamma-glutamylcyclotransferase (GGCT)/AIG2-like uncharacterized protein YtfP
MKQHNRKNPHQVHAIAQANRKLSDPTKQRTYVPKYYFAYGSNLNLEQMRNRCKTADVIGPATLVGWKLVFRGVADIVPAQIDDIVYGAVFHIKPEDERALDVYEGFPYLYTKRLVKVRTDRGKIDAMVYVMTTKNRRNIYPPNEWYLRSIHEGFGNFRLPRVHLHDAHKASKRISAYLMNEENKRAKKFTLEERPTVEDFIDYVADTEDQALINWARNLNSY